MKSKYKHTGYIETPQRRQARDDWLEERWWTGGWWWHVSLLALFRTSLVFSFFLLSYSQFLGGWSRIGSMPQLHKAENFLIVQFYIFLSSERGGGVDGFGEFFVNDTQLLCHCFSSAGKASFVCRRVRPRPVPELVVVGLVWLVMVLLRDAAINSGIGGRNNGSLSARCTN